MADLIEIEQGALPWKPNSSAEVFAVLHAYDGPRVGLIKASGVLYVFQAIMDRADGFGLWTYTIVRDDDAARLQEADDLDGELASLTGGHPSVLALTANGRVVASTDIYGVTPPAIKEGIDRALEIVGRTLSSA